MGALAVGANAWSYPDCEPDNCYRELSDTRFESEAPAFCYGFLAGTTTAAAAIPTDFGNCGGDVAAVSSACSCITYSHSTTSSKAPVSSTKSTTTPASSSASSAAPLTTSTIYTTKIYTVTSCAPTVTNCPGKPYVTTEIVALYTTVCPVSTLKSTTTPPPPPKTTPAPTGTLPPAKTTGSLPVTAAAGKFAGGLELAAAAAAGVVAVAFL